MGGWGIITFGIRCKHIIVGDDLVKAKKQLVCLSISINERIKEGGLYLAKAVCLKKNTIA